MRPSTMEFLIRPIPLTPQYPHYAKIIARFPTARILARSKQGSGQRRCDNPACPNRRRNGGRPTQVTDQQGTTLAVYCCNQCLVAHIS